ncbi:MAG: HD-GYP domain-containing protein [Bacillota bacterium]
MYKINVESLKNGMIIAKNIYDNDGNILLAAGIALRENYISKLKELRITEVYIQTDETADIVVEDVIQEQNRLEAKQIVKQIMVSIKKDTRAFDERILSVVESIVEDLLNNPNVMVHLADIRSVDEYTFGHSVNVCVLSVLLGIKMGYNKTQLKELGIGALLHDIGKMWVPESILNKPDILDEQEFEEIKKHTTFGYDFLHKIPGVPSISCMVALAHHERFDGSGYPFGKKSYDIHEYARIIAITDVYDALTSERIYKKKIRPFEAVEYLVSIGKTQFDEKMVKLFTEFVPVFPMGSVVKTNLGEKGVVLSVDSSFPTKPTIRILLNKDGSRCVPYQDIDLKKHHGVKIVDIIENFSIF